MIGPERDDRRLVRDVFARTRIAPRPDLAGRVRERVGEERRRRRPDGGWQLLVAGGALTVAMVVGLLMDDGVLPWPAGGSSTAAPRDATLGSEAPGVRPPGDWMHERIARADHYRPLVPMLWAVALYGPRAALLTEIGGTAAYRVLNREALRELEVPGALGSALERLRRESAALRSIAGWPGMSVERASRLLNALYLASALLVTHTHPAARTEPGLVRRLLHLGTRH